MLGVAVRVCECTGACTSVSVYIHMLTCLHAYTRMRVCVCVSLFVCMYVCMYVCMHACMYVIMYVYMCTCVCVYIYITSCMCTAILRCLGRQQPHLQPTIWQLAAEVCYAHDLTQFCLVYSHLFLSGKPGSPEGAFWQCPRLTHVPRIQVRDVQVVLQERRWVLHGLPERDRTGSVVGQN